MSYNWDNARVKASTVTGSVLKGGQLAGVVVTSTHARTSALFGLFHGGVSDTRTLIGLQLYILPRCLFFNQK